jgi:L-lysine 6-transaminase
MEAQFPGPKSKAMLDELGGYVVATPEPFVVDLEKSEGMWLATVDGQRIFDWCGYYGSKLVGHNHPRLYEPEYLKRLSRAANNKVANPDFLTPECLRYYRRLHAMAPASMRGDNLEVYAVNSGAEAVENMMKYLVARYNTTKMRQGRFPSSRRFIYFDNAFHGRTVFSLSVTQTLNPVATKDFHGLVQSGNIKLPWPEYDSDKSPEQNRRRTEGTLEMVRSALEQMRDDVVAVLAEPIQGAGGQRMAEPEFFQGLSELCHEHQVYLAFDEVQTGLGVTGKMWAIDHFDLPHPPEAVATGKKFGNGVVYMCEPLEDIGVLDSTWGGTLADMVRFEQEMQIVEEEKLVEAAAEKGEHLAKGLRALREKHPELVLNVRGMGLYQGFSLPTADMQSQLVEMALQEHSLLLLGAGDRSIRFRPNLSVAVEDVDEMLRVLDGALSQLE